MKRYTQEERQKYCKLIDQIGYAGVYKKYGINKATLLQWKNPKYKENCRRISYKWKKEHPTYLKQWHKKNPGYSTKKTREWAKNNQEQNKEMHRKSFNKLKADKFRYQQKIKNDTIYGMKRYKEDINYKILHCMRARLYAAITKDLGKITSIKKLLGCDIEFLKEYLGKQFQPGMSWNNYGKWEIDHIKPCSMFDMSNKSDRQKCFHYTNLQPLWKRDNRSKGCIIKE